MGPSPWCCLGKPRCPSQFLRWLVPHTAPWDGVPLLSTLAWLQRETRALREGRTLGLGEQVLTDGLVIFKRCTSQLRREKHPLEIEKRSKTAEDMPL